MNILHLRNQKKKQIGADLFVHLNLIEMKSSFCSYDHLQQNNDKM